MEMPTLIYCADGNPAFAQAAVDAGWEYGARLPSTVYQKVYFADQDWKEPDRNAYMKALAEHKPSLATVVDWEPGREWSEVWSWCMEASEHCEVVVIIPKIAGTVTTIPEEANGKEVRLAYSVPTSYGGSAVPLWEFGKRPIHLLGGSPQKQMSIARYVNVVSADGNMAHLQAHKCRFWSPDKSTKGHWVQLGETGDQRTTGANLAAFRLSLCNIRHAWDGL